MLSPYTFYACKISRQSKLNNHLIIKCLNIKVFKTLKLYIKTLVYESNSKKHIINMKFGLYNNNDKNM